MFLQPQSAQKLVALVCAEIGGANSVEPLTVGAELNMPVVDADGMGRAFPELQMFLPFVYGCPPYPAAVGNEKGEVAAVTFADTAKHLENFLRVKTLEMGSVLTFYSSVSLLRRGLLQSCWVETSGRGKRRKLKRAGVQSRGGTVALGRNKRKREKAKIKARWGTVALGRNKRKREKAKIKARWGTVVRGYSRAG